MNNPLAKIWTAVLAVALTAYGVYTAVRINRLANVPSGQPAKVIELTPEPQPLSELRNLALVERSGANFRWQQLDGKIWIANSFYSTCTAECSQLSQTIRALQGLLPEASFVSITCDPDSDTPERLRQYAATFDPVPGRWFFVTGNMRDLSRAGEVLFGAPLARRQHGGYVALVDQSGHRIGAYNALVPSGIQELVAAVEELKQKAAAGKAPRAPEPA